MAYSIIQPPYTLYPTDNLSWSTAYSSDYTQSAFVYKFSVQVGTAVSNLSTVSINRVPVTPGSTAASFAPNSILRNYVTTPVDFIGSTGGTASTEGLKTGRVVYGQEYNNNGTIVASTGATGTPFKFWNSIFSYPEWPAYDATQWITEMGATGVQFLTDGPSTRCIIPNDLLYINAGGSTPVYTKEDIFPPDSWDWPTYSGYPDFFDEEDDATTLPGTATLEWIGGSTGFILNNWPAAGTGESEVYFRAMPTVVTAGSTISVRVENVFGFGPNSTGFPRWALVGSNSFVGPWTLIGYMDVTINIFPSERFASFSGTVPANFQFIGIQVRVTGTQLSVPRMAGPWTTFTYTLNEGFRWNIDKGGNVTQYNLVNSAQNWINVPKAAGGDPCTVYVTDTLNNVVSETITYVDDCDDCTACEHKTLTWLNSKGGYDTFRFYCVNSRTIEAQRFNGQKTLPQAYAVGDRGLYNTANIGKLRSRVNTNYVLPETVEWLESLFISPTVFEVEDDGTLNPVVVDTSTYVRYAKPNRLMVVEFELTEANLRTSQIR